jgi:hypothetical protein
LNAVDFLSTIAQVSVAIAGFSGIVVAIGHRAAGALTAIERLRLVGLLAESFFILALVVTAMILLTTRWKFSASGSFAARFKHLSARQ